MKVINVVTLFLQCLDDILDLSHSFHDILGVGLKTDAYWVNIGQYISGDLE